MSLAALTATLSLGLMLGVEAQTVGGAKGKKTAAKGTPTDLKAGLMAQTKLDEKTIEKVLKALGPAVSEQLRAGRQIEFPGVGTLQVVRVTEYKDLVNGRPAMMPAKNYIEYVPTTKMNDDANSSGAKPARVVDGYEYRVNPNAQPGMKTPYTRTPGTRIR
jgi:nucleoid DNA-binding protein